MPLRFFDPTKVVHSLELHGRAHPDFPHTPPLMTIQSLTPVAFNSRTAMELDRHYYTFSSVRNGYAENGDLIGAVVVHLTNSEPDSPDAPEVA